MHYYACSTEEIFPQNFIYQKTFALELLENLEELFHIITVVVSEL